jgi:hypothetical protein
LRIIRRVAVVAVTGAAAAGLTLAGAVPALAGTQQAYVAVSAASTAGGNACGVLLLSAQVSSGGPG